MPRKKQYIEEEVIEKAMKVFWLNGYEKTSVRMLEKEMGINQFSINASFGNKKNVFLNSIKCYVDQLKVIIDKLEVSEKGISSIKDYFYDFLEFTKKDSLVKGCLINNTLNEFGSKTDPSIRHVTKPVVVRLSRLFTERLLAEEHYTNADVSKKVHYLLMCLQGLTAGSKIYNSDQVNDFIETIFEKL